MNIKWVNNTCQDISILMPLFNDAYETKILHEDLAGLFQITFLKGRNDDGTDRMIIEMADD